jgi:hypothetical protein
MIRAKMRKTVQKAESRKQKAESKRQKAKSKKQIAGENGKWGD